MNYTESITDSIVCGDCLEFMEGMSDNSVNLILTDPPYHKEFLHLWGPMAAAASRLLVAGGLLVTLLGHHSLDRIIRDMTKYLDFYWIGSKPATLGHVGRYHPRQMMCGSKPVLWFSKGKASKHDYVFDTINPPTLNENKEAKEFHEWGQDTRWFTYYAHKLSAANDLILDPFCGSGTTCIAAKMLGRHYIGIDISEKYCEIARKRIEAAEKGITVKELEKGQKTLFSP